MSGFDEVSSSGGSDGGNGVLEVDFQGAAESAAFGVWREEIGRTFLRLDFNPLGAGQARVETRLLATPAAVVGTTLVSPMQFARTPELVADGANDIFAIIPGTAAVEHASGPRRLVVEPGMIALWDVSESGHICTRSATSMSGVRFDRARLLPYCPDLESRLREPLLAPSPAAVLLRRYLDLVLAPATVADPAVRGAIGQHTLDLMALAIGATRDGAHDARQRGWKAARLEAIKADIVAAIARPGFSIADIAWQHRLSERSIQALFEDGGTTFTAFVLEQRLLLAYRLLGDTAGRARKVSDIAHSAGFGDLSYFHRSFRRRFGLTPAEARLEARKPPG